MLVVSLLLGTCVYVAIQLFWYSPFLFGPKYLELTRQSEEGIIELSAAEGPRKTLHVTLLPAFLLSFAVHAMRILFLWLPVPYFLLACLLSGIIPVLPKYIVARRSVSQLSLLQDGALVVSVFGIGCVALLL